MHAYIRLHYCVIQLLYASYVHNNMIAVETRIVCVYTGLYAQMIVQKKIKKYNRRNSSIISLSPLIYRTHYDFTETLDH